MACLEKCEKKSTPSSCFVGCVTRLHRQQNQSDKRTSPQGRGYERRNSFRIDLRLAGTVCGHAHIAHMLARLMAVTYGITRGRGGAAATSTDNNSNNGDSASPESEMENNNNNNESNSSKIIPNNDLGDNNSFLNKEHNNNGNNNNNQEEDECAPYRVLGVGFANKCVAATIQAFAVRDTSPVFTCLHCHLYVYDGRTNEVLVSPAARDAKSNVLFFPGDVHDFRANMLGGAFNEFADFAYERVADVLSCKFGSGDDCNVWIVRPARFHQRAFSCFDNFVDANEFGAATSCEL